MTSLLQGGGRSRTNSSMISRQGDNTAWVKPGDVIIIKNNMGVGKFHFEQCICVFIANLNLNEVECETDSEKKCSCMQCVRGRAVC